MVRWIWGHLSMKSGVLFARLYRVSMAIVTAGVLVFLVIGFQNCSQPVPVDSEAALASAAAKIEFAYDTSIDQISYMSCAMADNGTFDGSAYFSFRAGSYRNAGIRLSDSFRSTHGRKPPEKQSDLLSASPANTLTSVQFAVRQLANFQTLYTSSGTAVRGQDYVNVLQPLGTLEMSDTLVVQNTTARLRYLRNGTVYGARMEGSLYFTKNPTLSASIRTALRNDAMFAQTYSHSAGASADTFARSPRDVVEGSTANPNTQVYGRGYTLGFAQPTVGAVASNANFPNVILSSVSELNLLNTGDRSGLSTWTCPDTMRFRIARPEDVKAGRIACAMNGDPAILSADLAIVRNQLRAEDWYVDMANRCIVPKKAPATCYGTSATSVQYDITQTCTEGTGAACVSFASVCYRQ